MSDELPVLDFDPAPWTADAACAGVEPNLFFPTVGENVNPAKAVCATCTVRAECLQYALETHQRYGVWGGMSVKERRHLTPVQRRRIMLVVPTCA